MPRPTLQAKQGTFKERARGLQKELDFFGAKWAKGMDQFLDAVAAIGADEATVFRRQVGQMFANIQDRTPVDEGTARRGWMSKPGPGNSPDSPHIRITNTVPYIVYLEFGWSKQAPKGMVRIELDRFARNLKTAAQKVVA